MNGIEPLELGVWFSEVAKLRAKRARIDGAAPDALFRKAMYLVQLTPALLRDPRAPRTDPAVVEAYLECGAYVAAAMALVTHPTGVALRRLPGAQATTATVTHAAFAVTGEVTDNDAAKALLGAWCEATLMIRQQLQRAARDTPEPDFDPPPHQ